MKIRNIKHFIIFIIIFIIPFTAAATASIYTIAKSENCSSQNIEKKIQLQPQENEIIFEIPTIEINPEEIYATVPVVEPPVPSEYPTATYIWNTLKSWGWNDYVCAGIMGNLMRETAGDTFNIKPTLYDKSGKYYGICQWSAKYCPTVQGTDLDTQLNYLKNTVEKEFNTFGKLYYSGFTYWHFTQLTNERDAALAFAKCYERCSSAGYTKRQNNATRAYEYFVG